MYKLENLMRVLSALLLSLVLAIASVAMAVARGQAPMGPIITLCTDGGTVSVTLDANGAPVSTPSHLCPDCLGAAAIFDVTAPYQLTAPIHVARAYRGIDPQRTLPGRAYVSARARGPPTFSV